MTDELRGIAADSPTVAGDADGAAVSLAGGVGNAGAVVRQGDTVRRPPGPSSAISRAIVLHLEKIGFDRAQRYLGTDDAHRDVYTYVDGDVPLPPFPRWAQTDEVLGEVAQLLRAFHAAMRTFRPPPGVGWIQELADPRGGDVICHNDVCPENVVFRDGRAIALIDFDLAAPGDHLWDAARTVRMWAPLGAPEMRKEWPPTLDALARLETFARAYGLEPGDDVPLVDAIIAATTQGQAWVRRKVEAGEQGFVRMWNEYGLAVRQQADAQWLHDNREAMVAAVGRASS